MTIYGVTGATVRVRWHDGPGRREPAGRAGRIVAVVGGDGAGKTTLLRGTRRRGAARLRHGRRPRTRGGIGYLPASARAAGPASPSCRTSTSSAASTGCRAPRSTPGATTLLGARRAGARPATGSRRKLSGGMRRKLGFCMAMLHQPALLVLDEPSTGVDPVSRVDLWRLVAEAAAAGAAVVMSTTYLDEAERAALPARPRRGPGARRGLARRRPGLAPRCRDRRGATAERPQWSWRRGRSGHEYWPRRATPTRGSVVAPDLEDVVIALSLRAPEPRRWRHDRAAADRVAPTRTLRHVRRRRRRHAWRSNRARSWDCSAPTAPARPR